MLTRLPADVLEPSSASLSPETVDNAVANDVNGAIEAPDPGSDTSGEDVEMGDGQVEVSPPMPTGAPLVPEGSPVAPAPSDNTAELAEVERSAREGISTADLLRFDLKYVYIFIKYYDTEKQSLTAVRGLLCERKEMVLEAVRSSLVNTDIPPKPQASIWTVWKEVDLNNARMIEPSKTFDDEYIGHGSIFIAQVKPSEEE